MGAAPIPLCVPCLDGDEREWLLRALDSTFVSTVGPFVEQFEREFATAVGSPHAVACATGTAAIHLALRALGVAAGDLVLCSDFTFIASANPIRYQGAEAGFIDSSPDGWNLDPAVLVQALDALAAEGRLPKAVVAVHILGQPADLGPILEACARHAVPLIEDAAEALGASYTTDYPHAACRGRQVGTIGRIGCFSFNGNKLITTGGGGMVVTGDPLLAARIKHLSTQAKLPGLAFVHDEAGYNYRLPNLNAALGLAQLRRLDAFLARKRAIAARYRALATELGWTYQPTTRGTLPSDWLCSIAVGPARDRLLASLVDAGIGARPCWQPVSQQTPYAGSRRWGGRVAHRLAAEALSLPSSVGLSDGEQDRVLATLRGAVHA